MGIFFSNMDKSKSTATKDFVILLEAA